MNAETILRSDVLDIVFENRNKQYGAYTLRKEYNQRLYKALGIMLGMVLLLLLWNYWQNNKTPSTSGTILPNTSDTIILEEYDLEQPKPKIIEPPKTDYTKVKYVVPTIVPDREVRDTMKTIEEIDKGIISTETKAGIEPTFDNQASGNTTESTPAAAPALAPAPEPEVYLEAEVMPEFPGGVSALLRFLGRNLQVPEGTMEPGQRVKVPVKFVVAKDGSLTNVEFQGAADETFKKEIQRVLNKMPRWNPGSQHGKTVSVYFSIPIIFEVPAD
jgi:periplasmic protein TonB